MPLERFRTLALGTLLGGMLVAPVLLPACATSRSGADLDREVRIARGGRLYDKWFAETNGVAPSTRHDLYPEHAGYANKGSATWRCKECHGWDYLGRDGAYANGKHASGIVGIHAMSGTDPDALATALLDGAHAFAGHLSAEDVRDVALFVSKGQVEMDAVIDRDSRAALGDAERGAAHFAALCAGCHGAEGTLEHMPALGPLARKNPWETLHKILNGQPGSPMPALRTLDRQIAVDVLTFTQTLEGGE